MSIYNYYLCKEIRQKFWSIAPVNDKSPRRAYHKNCWRVIFNTWKTRNHYQYQNKSFLLEKGFINGWDKEPIWK